MKTLILNKKALDDETEQAYKRYGENEHEKVKLYIEGLRDGATWYKLPLT